mmetsp:Transcript_56683/g.134639  ORF Transcript_56683/g.134639 Transcript_56683/m.134639 type:complete len:915 (+) Transcript_56683:201-2945(+)
MGDACSWYPGWGGLLLAVANYALVGGLGLAIGYALFKRRACRLSDEEVESEAPARKKSGVGGMRGVHSPPASYGAAHRQQRKRSMTDFVLDADTVAHISLSLRVNNGEPGAVDELLLQVRSLELALAASKGQVKAMRDQAHTPVVHGGAGAHGLPSRASSEESRLGDMRQFGDLRTFRRLPPNFSVPTEPYDLTQKKRRMSSDFNVLLQKEDTSFSQLVDSIIAEGYYFLSAEKMSLFAVDELRQELWLAVSDDAAGVRVPIAKGIVGKVARTKIGLLVPRTKECKDFDPRMDIRTGFRTRSVICCPVILHGRCVAVLQALNKVARESPRGPSPSPMGRLAFSTEDFEMAQRMARVLGSAFVKKSDSAGTGHFTRTAQEAKLSDDDSVASFLSLYTKSAYRLFEHAPSSAGATPQAGGAGTPGSGMAKKRERRRSSLLFDEALVAYRMGAMLPCGALAQELTFKFDIFGKTNEELMPYVVDVYKFLGLAERFKIEDETLMRFASAVREGYHQHPFHNFHHGFSVFYIVFQMLNLTHLVDYLSETDLLAVLTAALCHDLDHPGVNNDFLINSADPLALLYNDSSILENHHTCMTFRLLKTPEKNIFANLTQEEFKEVRQSMIEGIGATDMKHHQMISSKMREMIDSAEDHGSPPVETVPAAVRKKATNRETHARRGESVHSPGAAFSGRTRMDGIRLERFERGSNSDPGADSEVERRNSQDNIRAWTLEDSFNRTASNDTAWLNASKQKDKNFTTSLHPGLHPALTLESIEDRRFIMGVLIHTADLSGQALGRDLAQKWGELVLDEFQVQVAKELAEGLPVAPFMNNLEDPVKRTKTQAAFVGYVLVPMWTSLFELFPSLEELHVNVHANLAHYRLRLESLNDHTPLPVPSGAEKEASRQTQASAAGRRAASKTS